MIYISDIYILNFNVIKVVQKKSTIKATTSRTIEEMIVKKTQSKNTLLHPLSFTLNILRPFITVFLNLIILI